MLRRFAVLAVACAGLGSPAHATPTTLLPGVTVERTVQFTLHGPVGLTVITAPRPGEGNGLYALAPVLARGTIAGGRDRLTRIERALAPQATVVGINGDFPAGAAALPAGIVMQGGALQHSPLPLRSSIGVDAAGSLHVDRVSFVGTWKGSGQRRPLVLVNQAPGRNQVSLFTPAYGAPVPRGSGTAEVVLEPFPAPAPGTDLAATVVAVGAGGGETIPPDGAVLQAAGTAGAPLKAEAPVGTPVTVRLILKPEWTGVASALGGGPVLVRAGKAVFRSGEDFASAQISQRSPRAAVGQLADGRVVLVAVDGGRPGSSVGMTSFELAQSLVRLGAVTASAVESGGAVTAAFDGNLLDTPSDASGERAVNEALLVEYFGVYAPPAPVALVNGDPGATSEPLEYKLVRPATVTAQVVAPDGVARVLEAAVAHQPGIYDTVYSSFDEEGDWHWQVTATDDLGRVSTIDRPFRYDTTLRSLVVTPAPGTAAVRFTLGRAASVRLRIETPAGVTVRLLPAVQLGAGTQRLTWDGRLPGGTRAPTGSYVAHVFASSDVGASDLSAPFAFRVGA
ncbi:MAG TPA: phosphodiester glycosidase family protein [Gaiellaceae bacterium]|nr:phosphodiester glycosidase family protein [Gaiellaceae bacterium]